MAKTAPFPRYSPLKSSVTLKVVESGTFELLGYDFLLVVNPLWHDSTARSSGSFSCKS